MTGDANDSLDRCLTVNQLAARWQVGPAKVRDMIRRGLLQAFHIGNGFVRNGRSVGARVRISPEAIRDAESKVLAVRPAPKKQRREYVPKHIAEMLERPRL